MIHHLAFRTQDLGRLERFYVEILGLAATRRTERSTWLAAGSTILMLERADAGEPAIPASSLELVAFAKTPGVEERLAAAGVALEGRTDCSIYFRDPDGRRIGVSSYPERFA